MSRHAERLLRFRREHPEEFTTVLHGRPSRRAIGGTGPSIVSTRLAWFWMFWTNEGNGVRSVDPLFALDAMYEHSLRTDAAPSRSAVGLGLIRNAQDAFKDEAELFVRLRTHPRLSKVEAETLTALQSYARTCEPRNRAIADRLCRWVQQGEGQTVLGRHARKWKGAQTPTVVFEELRTLVNRFPPRNESLGLPELVGTILSGPSPGRIRCSTTVSIASPSA